MGIQDEKERIDAFFKKLDNMLEITATQLCERYDFQKTALAKQFPLLMSKLWNGGDQLKPDQTVESVINQGTLGIGFIGLAECLVALTGKHHGESKESQELGLRIVGYMRSKANEFSERYNHNFSVLATPAEGLSGKFTKRDRKTFGIIKGVTDKEYYTNSNHVRYGTSAALATRLKWRLPTTSSLAADTYSMWKSTATQLTTQRLSPTSSTSSTSTTSDTDRSTTTATAVWTADMKTPPTTSTHALSAAATESTSCSASRATS